MPTYGYQCTECKHEFSVFQAMKDAPIEICPQCGSKVKRLLYPVGIVFKGSGWYINDSRKPDKSETEGGDKAEGKTDTDSKSKPEDKSGPESKPDTSGEKSGEKATPAPASTTPAASSSAPEK